MRKQNIEKFISSLIRDNTWKSFAILSVISFGFLILLDSFLFALAIELIKLCLVIIGFVSLAYAGYLAYPILKKKYETEKEKKS